jgi:hypothetical protein
MENMLLVILDWEFHFCDQLSLLFYGKEKALVIGAVHVIFVEKEEMERKGKKKPNDNKTNDGFSFRSFLP